MKGPDFPLFAVVITNVYYTIARKNNKDRLFLPNGRTKSHLVKIG